MLTIYRIGRAFMLLAMGLAVISLFRENDLFYKGLVLGIAFACYMAASFCAQLAGVIDDEVSPETTGTLSLVIALPLTALICLGRSWFGGPWVVMDFVTVFMLFCQITMLAVGEYYRKLKRLSFL